MGEQSLLDTECLAEQNGGLYIGVESEDNLAKALERIDKLPQAITPHWLSRSCHRSILVGRIVVNTRRRDDFV